MRTMILLYTKTHHGSSDVLGLVAGHKLPVELLNADVADVRNWMLSRSITHVAPSIIDLQDDGEIGLIQGTKDCLAFLHEQYGDHIRPPPPVRPTAPPPRDEDDVDPYATLQPQTTSVGYQPMVNAFTTTKNNLEPSIRIGGRKESGKDMSIMERAKQMNKEREDSMVIPPPPFS